MTKAAPTSADQHAKAQLNELIAYAEQSDQTLLAALLSEAADVLNDAFFMLRSDEG